MRKPVFLFLILTFHFLASGCRSEDKRIIGIKIYDYNGDYETLVSEWKSMGINTCFASSDMLENEAFRRTLKENRIQTFLIFPVFQDPGVLGKDSSLYAITNKGQKAKSDWVEFACPSRKAFREMKIREAARLIRELDPDVLSVDFIRHFVFWEMVYPDANPEEIPRACYCDSCLALFSEKTGLVFPDTCKSTVQKADFIAATCAGSWNDFRCELITSMAEEIASTARQTKPGIRVNIHAVPWRVEDFNGAYIDIAGQDLEKIAPFADYISPMVYSQMLKRDPAWISDVVRDMDRRCPGKVLPSIQVYPAYIDREFSRDEFGDCIRESLRPPSLGVVFFSWPLFRKDPERIGVAREIIRD